MRLSFSGISESDKEILIKHLKALTKAIEDQEKVERRRAEQEKAE